MELNLNSLNKNVLKAQYAVRGPIVILAQELEKKGKKIHYFNIGNPQELGQPYLTYVREVLALLQHPRKLLSNPSLLKSMFSDHSIKTAQFIMEKNPVGLGAYSQSAGIPFIRQAVADFITQRDNIPSSASNVFLTDGASKGVDLVLQSFITKKTDGIMIPIPQYPLYTADIALFGGTAVPYYLNEEKNWELDIESISEAYTKAQQQNINVKILVVINPNNPTGSVLSQKTIYDVVDFAEQNGLMIIADEVYQENVYDPKKKFVSFAKVIHDKGYNIPLFSLHSTSKGFLGECGYRGGYVEMRNIPTKVRMELLKIRSIGLCANTNGQIMTYLMVKPPEKDTDAYEIYIREKNDILQSLARKAKKLSEGLNKIEGVSCQTPQGAMYLFPSLELPHNPSSTNPADFDFCKSLVEETGIVTVPGSGFGQKEGTYHLRMTILPPEKDIPEIIEKFADFYYNYTKKR